MATKSNVATPEMLNAIRNEASSAYQNAVPVATPMNLTDVGNPILTYTTVANEFLDALVNKIVAQVIYRKMWNNPLAVLKKDAMPLGMDVEEMQANPATASAYDGTDTGMADLLKVQKPDVKAAWYRLNRTEKYKVTINNDQLTNAFTSWPNLEGFIAMIVDTLYNGATIDEFKYTKQLITDAYTDSKINTVTVTNPTNQDTGRAFQVALRNLSMQFTFPSSAYNNYVKMGGTGARISWSPIEDQIIIIRADVAANIGVEVLSAAFNISYADYLARQIIVDSFDAGGKVLAVLADTKAFQIREKLRQFATFWNAASLSWQYYFHCWDTFSLSPFHNATALVTV